MTPFSFLTGDDGDLDLTAGLSFTPDLETYVAQRLDENFSFFLGEWFLDLRLGIPYWERIIGAKPDLGLIDTLYRRAALATPGVASVKNLQVSFVGATRKLPVALTVRLVDGGTVTSEDLKRPLIVNF